MALTPPCVIVEDQNRETIRHGTVSFPLACYEEDMTCYSVPWHWHDDLEFILCERGVVTVNAGKLHAAIRQGQGIFINAKVLHSVEFAAAAPSLLHSGVFHPSFTGSRETVFWQKYAAPILAPGAPQYFLLDGSEKWHDKALDALNQIWSAVKEDAPDYENLARYLLTSVLRLLGEHGQIRHAAISPKEQEASERLKQMLRFIEEHYSEEITVGDIAASIYMSERSCLRDFRCVLGITPIQYVKQYRIEKAAELLLYTDRKAGEIGAECGFYDASYFTRIFRRMKNCTPLEYREQFSAARKNPPENPALRSYSPS